MTIDLSALPPDELTTVELYRRLAAAERDLAAANGPGTAGGRMRVVRDWIHEEGAGREAVLERLCPGWSIVCSTITSEGALMVAFDVLVADLAAAREALRVTRADIVDLARVPTRYGRDSLALGAISRIDAALGGDHE